MFSSTIWKQNAHVEGFTVLFQLWEIKMPYIMVLLGTILPIHGERSMVSWVELYQCVGGTRHMRFIFYYHHNELQPN